jgi:hypothetical protein
MVKRDVVAVPAFGVAHELMARDHGGRNRPARWREQASGPSELHARNCFGAEHIAAKIAARRADANNERMDI